MSFIRISECGKNSPFYETLKMKGILDECPRCKDLGEEGGCPECGLMPINETKSSSNGGASD